MLRGLFRWFEHKRIIPLNSVMVLIARHSCLLSRASDIILETHSIYLYANLDSKTGESCTFSAASSSEGWAQHFVAPLASEIHFVPAFFVDPQQLATGDAQGKGGFAEVADGDFNVCCLWNN